MKKCCLLKLYFMVWILGWSMLCASGSTDTNMPAGYVLAWSDEFKGAYLDTNAWDYRAESFKAKGNIPSNVFFTNGCMAMMEQSITNSSGQIVDVGVQVSTEQSFRPLYGYFECQMLAATNQTTNYGLSPSSLNDKQPGVSTTIWLQMPFENNTNFYPATNGTEMDIMEDKPSSGVSDNAIHFNGYVTPNVEQSLINYVTNAYIITNNVVEIPQGTNYFGLLWTSNSNTYFSDSNITWQTNGYDVTNGTKYYGISNTNEYLILQVRSTGNGTTKTYGVGTNSIPMAHFYYARYYMPLTNLVWAGSNIVNSTWDINNTTNWSDANDAPIVFNQGNYVLFTNNTAFTNVFVTNNYANNNGLVNGGVLPGWVTVNNDTTHPYTFYGGLLRGIGLTKTGVGSLTLSNNSTFSEGMTISNGSVIVAGAGQLGSGDYGLNITNNGSLIYNSSAAQWLGGTISGSGTLAKNGTNVFILTGSNTYSGLTTINGGTLSGDGWFAGPMVVSNVFLYPDFGAAFTISNNLTILGTNNVAEFNLSTTANGANDQVALVGNQTLTGSVAQIIINAAGGALDTNDYVLFNVSGGTNTTSISSSIPVWVGPAINYYDYGIVTNKTSIVLRYLGDFANTNYWTGASTSSANWSDPNNWLSNAVPSPTNTCYLVFTGTNQQTNTNDIPNLVLGGVTMTNGSWDILGDAVSFYGNAFKNTGTNVWEINTLLERTVTVTVSNNCSLYLTGVISGPGGISKAVSSAGAGTLYLSNTNNTFTGPCTFPAGPTVFYGLAPGGGASSLGAATGTAGVIGLGASGFATALIYSGNNSGFTDRGLSWYNSASVTMALSNNSPLNASLTFNGPNALNFPNPPGNLVFGGTSTGTNLFTGPFTNYLGTTNYINANLSLNGPGAWVFSAPIYLTGALTNAADTMFAGGNTNYFGSVQITPGSTLSGNDWFAGSVTVANATNAVLYPDDGGALTISNNLTFLGSSAVAEFNLSSSGISSANDRVMLAGSQTLAGGGAQVVINATAGALDTSNDYVLFNFNVTNGTISSGFNSIPVGVGPAINYYDYSVMTTSSNVVLHYVKDFTNTYHWNGGSTTSANWSDPSNWVEQVSPSPTNTCYLVFTGTNQQSNTNDIPNLVLGGVTMTNGSWNIFGDPVAFYGNSFKDTGTNVWWLNTLLEQTVTATVSNNCSLYLKGILSGPGSVTKDAGLAGAGVLYMYNTANTFTGPCTFPVGSTVFYGLATGGTASSFGTATGANGVIGLGNTNLSTVLVYSGKKTGTTDRTFSWYNSTNVAMVFSNNAPLNANLTFNGMNTVNFPNPPGNLVFTGTSTGTNFFNGIFTNAVTTNRDVNLTVSGSGTWVFNNEMRMTGNLTNNTTAMFAGTSYVGNIYYFGNVYVNSGGTLSGDGVFAGSVTVATNAVLYPNDYYSPLTISNNLTFQGGSAVAEFNLSGATNNASDQVILAGGQTLACGGAQVIINAMNGVLDTNDYVLFGASGGIISSNFNSTPVAGTPVINYYDYSVITTSSNNVVLHYVANYTNTYHWSGNSTTSAKWSDPNNWLELVSPSPTNTCYLVFTNTSRLINTNDIAGLVLGGVTFNNGPWNINGNAVTFAGIGVNAFTCMNSSTGTNVWALNTFLGQTLALTASNNCSVNLSGVLSGPGGVSGSSGAGTLYLSNPSNSFTGPCFFPASSVVFYSLSPGGTASSLGAASGTAGIITNGSSGNYMDFIYGGTTNGVTDRGLFYQNLTNVMVAISNNSPANANLTFNGSNLLNFSGLPGNLVFGGSSTGTNLFTGIFTNAVGQTNSDVNLTVSGPGMWEFNNSLFMTGNLTNTATAVFNGTNDFANVYVNSGGTLSGSGVFAGSMTVTNAVLYPDCGSALIISNNLTFQGGNSAAEFNLSSSATNGANDQVVLAGGQTLAGGGAKVIINATDNVLDTNDYVLFDVTNGTVGSSFSSTPVAGTPVINYYDYSVIKVGSNVVLHYVTNYTNTYHWSGGGSTANWNDPSNWLEKVSPSNNSTCYLVFTNTVQQSNSNNIVGLVLGGVTFTNGPWNISGNAVTFDGMGANAFTCMNSSAGTNVWGLNTFLGQTLALNLSNNCSVNLTGVLSGPGGLAKGVSSAGAGMLYLSNPSNSFTGPCYFPAASMVFYSLAPAGTPSSLGAASGTDGIITNGKTGYFVNFIYGGTNNGVTDRGLFYQNLTNVTMAISNNSPTNVSLTFNGPNILNFYGAPGNLMFGGSSTSTNLFTGPFTNAVGQTNTDVNLTVNGPGTWMFNNMISMTGNLTNNTAAVFNGTNDFANVYVNSGGTLSGSGWFAGAVTVANAANAMLYPDCGSALTISNNLIFQGSSAVAEFNLSGSATNGANDQVVLAGNETLAGGGAQVVINATAGVLDTNDYVIFNVTNGIISSSFSSTPVAGTPVINYYDYSVITNNSNVVLHYITNYTGTYTWSGLSTTSSVWTDPNNWSGKVAPSTNSTCYLVFTTNNLQTNTNNIVGLVLGGVTLTNGPWNINGNAVTFAGIGANAFTCMNSSTGTNVWGLNTFLGQTLALNVSNNCSLNLSGMLSGPGGLAKGVSSAGAGMLYLSNPSNSFTGPCYFPASSVVYYSLAPGGAPSSLGAAAGTDGIITNGKTGYFVDFIFGGITNGVTDRSLTWYNTTNVTMAISNNSPANASLTFNGSNILNFSGLPGNLVFGGSSTGTNLFTGPFYNSVGQTNTGVNLTLDGQETWVFSNTMSMTGTLTNAATAVFAGTNYFANIYVNSGSTLSDNGLFAGGATVMVATNATLAGNGIMNSSNNVVLVNGTLEVGSSNDINGATFTITNSGGLVISNGALNVSLFGGAGNGDNTRLPATADQLEAQCPVTFTNATLNVGNPNGITNWALGDEWKIINWSSTPTNMFMSTNLPALTNNSSLRWSTASLYSSGVISIISSGSGPKVIRNIISQPPLPVSILGMTVSGGNLIIKGTNPNGGQNFHYTVLTSTNLTLPLSNWLASDTNSFNADGTFDYTNPISPSAPAMFYNIKVVP